MNRLEGEEAMMAGDGSGANAEASEGGGSDRRSNLVLRALIDEMLERVRELNRNSSQWDPNERSHAEGELDAIMARVRRVASRKQAE